MSPLRALTEHRTRCAKLAAGCVRRARDAAELRILGTRVRRRHGRACDARVCCRRVAHVAAVEDAHGRRRARRVLLRFIGETRLVALLGRLDGDLRSGCAGGGPFSFSTSGVRCTSRTGLGCGRSAGYSSRATDSAGEAGRRAVLLCAHITPVRPTVAVRSHAGAGRGYGEGHELARALAACTLTLLVLAA